MPRFVRPSWLEVSADGGTSRGTGPRSRDGWLAARLTLRTPSGGVSDAISLDAGGKWTDNAGRAALGIPRTFAVQVEDASGAVTTYAAGDIRRITIRPTED